MDTFPGSGGVNSTRAQALYTLGCTNLEHGDVREAYEELKEATRLDPNNLEIWQKYEEAHKAVKPLLAKEQNMRIATPAMPNWGLEPRKSQAPSKSHPNRSQQGDIPENEIPPTFTFVAPDSSALAEHDEEAEERSANLAARIFQGGLLDGTASSSTAFTTQRQLAELGYGEGPTPVNGAATAEDEGGLGFNVISDDKHAGKMILFATILCWLTVWFTVTIWYQWIRKKKYTKEDVSVPMVIIYSSVIVVTHFAWWRCAMTCRIKHFSMSDAIKVACGIIIVMAVVWFEFWEKPAQERRDAAEKAEG